MKSTADDSVTENDDDSEDKDYGQPLFITSVACMSRSMSGMGSELIVPFMS